MIARIQARFFVGAAIVSATCCVATSKAQTSTWEDKANGQGPFLCCTNGTNCSQFFWPDNDKWEQPEVLGCTPQVVRQPSNWTTSSYPNGFTYDAVIDSPPTVQLTTFDINLNSLTIGTNGALHMLTNIDLAADLHNNGLIHIGIIGNAATFNLGTGITNDAVIEGAGGAIIFPWNGWDLADPNIVNNGVIRAVDGGGLTIYNAVIANNGSIAALDDSTVNLSRSLVTGGQFQSGAGTSRIQLLSGSSNSSALSGFIVNNGIVQVTSPSTVTIYGDTELSGNGQLLLIAGGSLAGDPATDPAMTTDHLRNSGNHIIRCGAVGSAGHISTGITFTNDAVIEGGGCSITFASDGWNLSDPDIVNHGVIRAVDGGALTISNAVIANNGLIAALDDSIVNLSLTLVIGGQLSTGLGTSEIRVLDGSALSGLITNNGFLHVDTLSNPATIHGQAELTGNGNLLLTDSVVGDPNTDPATTVDRLTNGVGHTIRGNRTIGPGLEFINQGIIEPGTSVGTLTVSGPFTQSASGVLSVELASLTSRDRLVVNGPATLDGTIDVSFLAGFLPALGNQFQILTATSITGSFSSVFVPPGWHFQANTNSTSVTLQVVAVCGDSTCGPGETPCNCPADCGAPPSTETDCGNALDEDCDGLIDCVDADCAGDITNCPNGQVPAVSDWGMVILTLLTLTAATFVLMGHRSSAAARTL